MTTTTRDGISLYYEVSGLGPPIVLIHGFLCDGSLFTHQVAVLERTHRVINIDLRGHGRSGPSESPYTLYDLVDDVVAILDAEGVATAIWMGLSIGGFISLRAALTRPERVRALVLIDTDAGPETAWNKLKYATMKGVLQTMGVRYVVPAVMPIMFGKTTRRSRPELTGDYYQRLQNLRVKSICPGVDAIIRRDDIVGRLSEIKVPTLVIVGEEDKTLPLWKSRRIVNGIPDAEFALIPQAGHVSAIENPAPVTDAVTRFLSKVCD